MTLLLLSLALAADPVDPPVADEEIVVEAGEEVARDASSVTVITVDEDLPASEDVASAVDGAPGVVVRRLGGLGDFASVSIRGSAARQVEVYLDGIPLNPEGAETANLAELPLRAFERIEVYRGSAPPELGGAAMGGVVNLVTGESLGSSGAIGAGSWGTLTGHLAAARPLEDGDVLVVAEGLRTDGRFPYLDDRGTATVEADDRVRERVNNDRQQGTLHLRVRKGRWSVLSSSLARESGVPGFTWLPVEEARFRALRELLVVGFDEQGTEASGGVRAWGQVREERLDDPAGEIGFTPGTLRVGSHSGGVRGQGRRVVTRGITAVGAMEARVAGIRSGDAWIGGRQAWEGTVAAVLRDSSERLALTPVLQATSLSDAADGARQTVHFAAPRVGLLVGLSSELALTANVGSAFRPPDLQERFGNQGVLVGNPELRPERGLYADAGLKLLVGGVRGELVGFVGRARDRIGWLQNSQGLARPENLDRVDTAGAELANTGEAGPVDWRASFTWTEAVQRGGPTAWDGEPVPGVPRLEYHHGLGLGSEAVRLGTTLDAASGTPLDAAGFFLTAPRVILGASARVTDGPLSLELDVLNLLDRTTEQTARDPLVDDGTRTTRPVTDFFGYPLPGRTFLLTLRLGS